MRKIERKFRTKNRLWQKFADEFCWIHSNHSSILDAPSALLSHADLCKLRYQTTSFTALYGLTQSMSPPGIPIYHSSIFLTFFFVFSTLTKENFFFPWYIDQYVALERSTTSVNPIDIELFLQQYPQYTSTYKAWQRLTNYMQVK